MATALTALVFVIWVAFFAPKPPEPRVGPAVPTPSEGVSSQPEAPRMDEAGPPAPEPSGTVGFEPAVAGAVARELSVRTPLYEAVISGAGGGLRSWRLLRYRSSPEKLGGQGQPIEMIPADPAEAARRPLTVFTGDSETDALLAGAVHQFAEPDTESIELAAGERGRVVLRWSDGMGHRVRKELEFDGSSYAVAVKIEASVARGNAFVHLGSGLGEGAAPERQEAYSGRVAVASRGELERPEFRGKAAAYSELQLRFGAGWPPRTERKWLAGLESQGELQRLREVDWAAVEDNYFAALFHATPPLSEVAVFPAVRPEDKTPHMTVALALGEGETRFHFFAGPKAQEVLGAVRPDLTRLINFGFFEMLAKALFWALRGLNGFLGNYGLSIILLTVIIKVLFLPLTIQQLKTMQKMSSLQPQLKVINERYARIKGDAQARMEASRAKQQEVAALYQKEGVNPLGGCLPLLLYMPILYGFYAVLGSAIELRQAPFVLWVQDLSAKDPLYVTPVLMMISMIVQQAITPSTMEPAQQRIMYIMPVVMTWIFKDLASGLVLFWLTNNVLQIVQQMWMNRLTERRAAEDKESRKKKKSAARSAEEA